MTPRWDAELTSFVASRRRILARRRRFVRLTVAAAAIVLLVSGGVFAWFKSAGSANASGVVGSLHAPGKPATSVTGTTVHVSWSAGTLSDGSTGIKYHVERRPEPGSGWTDVCSSSAA